MSEISKTKSFLVALIIIMGLIFLNFPVASNKIRSSFYSISSPIQKKFNKFIRQIEDSWFFLNSLKKISKKNIELEEEIKKITAQNVKLKELEKENQFLRSHFDLPASQEYSIDLANIIGVDFQGLEKYFLIDKGSLNGISKDMPAIAFENILIGKVITVSDNFSKILLITSPNSKIPALIQESRIEGLIKGMGTDTLSMDLVSKDKKIEVNQTITTSGIGAIFPRGLLIGKVLIIEFSENKMFQKITVKPATNIEKLEQVFIIK